MLKMRARLIGAGGGAGGDGAAGRVSSPRCAPSCAPALHCTLTRQITARHLCLQRIIFSSLIELNEDLEPFSILKDSIPIPFKYQLESPQLVKIFPEQNWKPKTLYNINIFQKGIIPIYGKGLNDSLFTIGFNTSDYQGFGSLKIKITGSHSQDLVAELREFKKEKSAFRTVVNSEGIISMNYIPEGNYSLMFFQDIDDDLDYSYGNIDPYFPSEWFYNYPDTVKIRSNWEIELNQSNIELIY